MTMTMPMRFFMDDRYGSDVRAYFSDYLDDGEKYSSDVTLRQLRLKKGDKFKFLFDFGDEWRFQCRVLRELEERTDIPGVIRTVGEAPEQYPDWEEDYEEDDDEEMEPEEECALLTEEDRKKLFSDVPATRETIDEIRKYLRAAASLYGLLRIEDLFELYNSQNPPMEEAAFMLVLAVIDLDMQPEDNFLIVDIPGVRFDENHPANFCQVVTATLLDDLEQGIRQLRRQQKGKPLKIFPKEAFLKFADEAFSSAARWHRSWPSSSSISTPMTCWMTSRNISFMAAMISAVLVKCWLWTYCFNNSCGALCIILVPLS